ncbi:NERD domain-containing protein [Halomonas tibetensis]|uniref:NERD domain-containing protein n=1 Tax=Halomonas tibetensis TaxID=2259590 RepID=A0ABV7B925_9GAMM
MRMIPASPHKTESTAEKRVFDVLRRIFGGPHNSEFIAYHSLNLTRHVKKRFGEIDFLIVGPLGIYVLEVKGGRVSCSGGVWQYTNKNNDVNMSYEGPFKQAESALHGLVSKLREKLPHVVTESFSIGYGVVFPDCRLAAPGVEWDPQMVCDDGAHKDLERWLKRLFRYWRAKDSKERHASTETVNQLAQFLRPEFEAVVPLHSRTEEAYSEIKRLTESQMAFVDSIELNTRIICSGGAGTGKTLLAVEVARRWTADESQIALVCSSPWLMSFLKNKFLIPGLTVCTVLGLKNAARRAGLDKFDALIIDEGQDLLSMGLLSDLDAFLNGGLEEGKWCFFHDVNNQSGLFGKVEPEAVEYLNSLNSFRVPLKRNCRNTKIILDKVKTVTGADAGVFGAGVGPEVVELKTTDCEDLAAKLSSEIHRIVQEGGLPESDVTVLLYGVDEKAFLEQLPDRLRNKLVLLDEFSMQSFPPQGVSLSKIDSFKGLENEAVILVGMPQEINNLGSKAQAYVAMSRARSVLSIIYS